MFKRLFLVSFDCHYSLVCEVCSVNVLSLLLCHDMYVNVFTTYIYHARHAVLVFVDMGGRGHDFRVKHKCGSAIQTLLVICTISNTSTSYSMSLYEMSVEKCLLRTLLHIEWSSRPTQHIAMISFIAHGMSASTTAHVYTASKLVCQLVFALYMYVSALQ